MFRFGNATLGPHVQGPRTTRKPPRAGADQRDLVFVVFDGVFGGAVTSRMGKDDAWRRGGGGRMQRGWA